MRQPSAASLRAWSNEKKCGSPTQVPFSQVNPSLHRFPVSPVALSKASPSFRVKRTAFVQVSRSTDGGAATLQSSDRPAVTAGSVRNIIPGGPEWQHGQRAEIRPETGKELAIPA